MKMKLFWKEKIRTGTDYSDEENVEYTIEDTFIRTKTGSLKTLAKKFALHSEALSENLPDEGSGSTEFIALTDLKGKVMPEFWFRREMEKVERVISWQKE